MGMTLSELLALLPDNTTGQIGADDMRTITTELFNAIQAVQDTNALTATWQFNTTPYMAPPDGQFSTDTGAIAGAAFLRFANKDAAGVDQSAVLIRISELYGQDASNAANWIHWACPYATNVGPGYVDVPISVLASGGTNQTWPTAQFVMRWMHS
jgi:hypothetical protein